MKTKNLFFKLLLLISTLLLIYTFYKSEIYWDGSKRDKYLTYYILIVSLILFSILCFKFSENIKRYIIIIFLSFTFSCYAFESFLMLKPKKIPNIDKKIKIYKKLTGKNFDTRSQFEVYNDLRKNNDNVSVIVPHSYHQLYYPQGEVFPFSGLSNSKTVYRNENGYYFIYLSDRYGFNNPDKEWDAEEIEYLIIGDSFAHGASVNRPDDIASVLRKLSKKAVLNLGYSDNGPLIEYATLREFITPKVKNILWLYFEGNDFLNLNREIQSELLKKYLYDPNFSQNIKSKQNIIDIKVKEIIEKEQLRRKKNLELDFKKEAFDFLKIFRTRYLIFGKKFKEPDKFIPEFKLILKKAKNLATDNGANFYFVYLPQYQRYNQNHSTSEVKFMGDKLYGDVKKTLSELNIDLIDINSTFLN
jgi:hypothetical protein